MLNFTILLSEIMKLTTFIQYCIPQHAFSRLFGKLLSSKHQGLKNRLIRKFIAHYNVNMEEVANPNLDAYPSFNDFFIRTLKKGARPLVGAPEAIASPVDGTIAQIGIANGEQLIQAKGHHFSLKDLLAGDVDLAKTFANGPYTTIYLGPSDYHRVHMPMTGTLKQMIYVPGKLFSVNTNTVNDVENIFARNERVICIFNTKAGPMAVILVGAIFVGSMAVAWEGVITPNNHKTKTIWSYEDKPPVHLARGDELGYFVTGSTVITLFGENRMQWQTDLKNNIKIKMGQGIGTF
jgi:phosphatidylserine decarboxylase